MGLRRIELYAALSMGSLFRKYMKRKAAKIYNGLHCQHSVRLGVGLKHWRRFERNPSNGPGSEQFRICASSRYTDWKGLFSMQLKGAESKLQAGELKIYLDTKMDQ